MIKFFSFLSLLFAALALTASGAHLLELANKIDLPAAEYLIVQQIYRGWALLGIVVVGALVSTLVLTILLRGRRGFGYALTGLLAIAGTQVVFWVFTWPMNRQTENWTTLPANWMALRAQWEYSHAASAVLNLTALIALILCVLVRTNGEAARRE